MQTAKKRETFEAMAFGSNVSALLGDIGAILEDQDALWDAVNGKSDLGHNHNLNDLTEKSYNSLTDKPLIPTSHTELTAIGTKTHEDLESDISDIQDNIPVSVSDATEKNFVSPNYIISRGQNLVTNGSGLLENNYNFPTLIFDSSELISGGGSFLANQQGTHFASELLPIDTAKVYELSIAMKAGDQDGSNYSSSYTQYVGLNPLDIDGFRILSYYYKKYPGSTDTTLASALNTGDSSIILSDATGWYDGTTWQQRQMVWWPYVNSKGYMYPDYTYSRNNSRDLGYSAGLWGTGGISGNTITLTSNWTGPDLPAGTKVRNNYSSGTYLYLLIETVPNQWTIYKKLISKATSVYFPPGMAYAQLLFLINYSGNGDPNNIRFSNISFSEIRDKHFMASKSEDEADPPVGFAVMWLSDGTGSGNEGDIVVKHTDSLGVTTTKKVSLVSL